METKTDLEMKLEDLLKNVEGVGNVKVMLMTESGQGLYGSGGNEVTGVLIVAEGADNSVTVRKIQEAVIVHMRLELFALLDCFMDSTANQIIRSFSQKYSSTINVCREHLHLVAQLHL